jgi:hypothetical protein
VGCSLPASVAPAIQYWYIAAHRLTKNTSIFPPWCRASERRRDSRDNTPSTGVALGLPGPFLSGGRCGKVRPCFSWPGAFVSKVFPVLLPRLAGSPMKPMKRTPRCPRCDTYLVVRKVRLLTYLTCPNYPNCRRPINLPKGPQSVREQRCAA